MPRHRMATPPAMRAKVQRFDLRPRMKRPIRRERPKFRKRQLRTIARVAADRHSSKENCNEQDTSHFDARLPYFGSLYVRIAALCPEESQAIHGSKHDDEGWQYGWHDGDDGHDGADEQDDGTLQQDDGNGHERERRLRYADADGRPEDAREEEKMRKGPVWPGPLT